MMNRCHPTQYAINYVYAHVLYVDPENSPINQYEKLKQPNRKYRSRNFTEQENADKHVKKVFNLINN